MTHIGEEGALRAVRRLGLVDMDLPVDTGQRQAVIEVLDLGTFVVMREDDGCGVMRQRAFDHFARIHAGLRQRAAEHLVVHQQPVLAVQVQHREDFVRQRAQCR